MKEFTYKIKDNLGIHARPAGLLVKAASGFVSDIKVIKEEKTADAKKIFAVMGMGVKKDDTVRVQITGSDEEQAVVVMEGFFRDNL
ncbi:MAG: HPr family phosphocarrier protein [Ruminococcaceae bacterium]|nr:HPr family phosphocarrier protein [Oscillospiraceae bacterium]